MEENRGSNCNESHEMMEVLKNEYEDSNGKHVEGKLDKESLVSCNRNTTMVSPAGEVTTMTYENSVTRNILISFVVLLLIAVCMVVIVLVVRYADSEAANGGLKLDSCISKNCVTSSATLINGANFSANPCHDFYNYACGGWKAINFLPENKPEWNGFTSRRETNSYILKRALESTSHANRAVGALRKVYDFYNSCKNEKQINALGAEPLKKLLQKLGSWPLLNNTWTEAGWDFENVVSTYHGVFFSYFHAVRPAPIFNSYVKVNDKNSSSHIISVDEPEFLLIPRNFKTEPSLWKKIHSAYELMIREYVKLLGGNSSSTVINDLLELEMQLANASTPIVEFRDVVKSYKTMPLKELTDEIGRQFNWMKYLKKTFEKQRVEIDDKTMIGTRSLRYLKAMNNILATTSKRTLANYLGWVVVYKFGAHLSEEFRQADFKFRQVLLGVKKDTDTWFKCLHVVEDNLNMGVARIFSKETWQDKAKETAESVIKGVKETFIARIKQIDWMDDETKKIADNKAKRTIYDIGYPEFINDETKLDKIYETLDISISAYLENLVNSYKWRRENNLNLISMPVNKRIWDLPPTEVNAYYDVSNNKMVFLAGILGNPFFGPNGPKSLLYGSFGFVAGHEITHGFDDQGRRYDPHGNLKDWWTKSSTDAFNKKASCIERQYSAYEYKGFHVNGSMTLGENIADIGGLKIAYTAYMKWVSENGEEPSLPGIDLNHKQLFFLSYGQLWCSLYNEQKGKKVVKEDVHSLPDFRVIGPLSNMDEFARAFDCPADAPMMRKTKCEMW